MASCDNDVVGAEVCLVSQIPGHTNVSAEAGIPARTYHNTALITVQRNTHVCVCSSTHTHTYKCICVCGVCVCECEWDSESLWAFGCSTGEDKVVWCLLTWSMIHNWGRTAVAGCTDRSQGGWQMIGPSGAELSISPNVLCPLSAHLSFISLPDICKPSSHRSAILFCSLNMISCCSIKDYCRYHIQGGHQIIKNPIYNQIIFCVSVNSHAVFKQSHKKLLSEY